LAFAALVGLLAFAAALIRLTLAALKWLLPRLVRPAIRLAALRRLPAGLLEGLRRLRQTLGHGGEPVGSVILLLVLNFRLLRRTPEAHGLLLRLLGRRDQPVVMLGVLEIVLRHHRVAGGLGVAGKLEIFFRDMLRGAPDFDVGAVALIGARQRIGALPVVIAAPQSLVLPWSHLSSLMESDHPGP
jgi:hypothetical protein